MSSILFLFVIQAFLDTLNLQNTSISFNHFPENKNGNTKTIKGRLLSQNTNAKGSPFFFNSSFYIDDSFFLCQSKQELRETIIQLNEHFARFGLIMHLGSDSIKSKSEAMYFPPSLKQARDDLANNRLPEDILLPNEKKSTLHKQVQVFRKPYYPPPQRINKAKSIMGATKYFFDNKDIDKRIKSQIYVAGPLNALLWGCESWNLTKNNLRKLTAFHHGAIRRILGIKWNQVREPHIKNKEVRESTMQYPGH